MDIRRLALMACANAGLGETETHRNTTRGVDGHCTHDDAPMVDLIGADPFLPVRAQDRVNQEMVNGVDGSSDEDQSDENNISDKEDDDVDKEYSGPVIESTSLRRGTRVKKQVKYIVLTHKG